MVDDNVNHPAHYTQFSHEVIELAATLDFCLGNVLIARSITLSVFASFTLARTVSGTLIIFPQLSPSEHKRHPDRYFHPF